MRSKTRDVVTRNKGESEGFAIGGDGRIHVGDVVEDSVEGSFSLLEEEDEEYMAGVPPFFRFSGEAVDLFAGNK